MGVISLDSVPNHSIDLNTATISELAENPYISPSLASRIVAYRTFHEEKISWNSIADKFELDSIRIARIFFLTFDINFFNHSFLYSYFSVSTGFPFGT